MEHSEDPSKHTNYLQQCLSSDKKPLALLIGAGCPTSIRVGEEGKKTPLIPDIAGVSAAVRKAVSEVGDLAPLLVKIEAHLKKDGREGANIEYMLSHIRALRAVAGSDEVRGMTAEQLVKLDEGVCNFINDIANKELPTKATPYHKLAAWVDAVPRDKPVEIFTTNYDLLVEQALEESRVSFFDGFAGVRRPFFDIRAMEEDTLPSRWARVWKLHGSINWYMDADKGVIRGGPNELGLRRVIHPTHLKYDESRRMPYLAMMDRLRAFLKQPMATLLICGYSFNDIHINEVIVQGLQGTQTASAFGLMYGELKNYDLALKAGIERPNLSLLAADGAVIGSRRAVWTQRQGEVFTSDSDKWVKWTPVSKDKPEGAHAAQFLLGDFALFGDFLQDILGESRHPDESSDAE